MFYSGFQVRFDIGNWPFPGKKRGIDLFRIRLEARIEYKSRISWMEGGIPLLAIVFHTSGGRIHIFGQRRSSRGGGPRVRGKVPKETFTAKLTTNPGHSYSH